MLGVSKALGWPTLHLLVPLPLYPRLFGSPPIKKSLIRPCESLQVQSMIRGGKYLLFGINQGKLIRSVPLFN